ncbi:hypothetical protein M406DRAFT_321523 [Cryphonectria parasitica EP155]|uniref:Uncharacterized protein n=1 Tax=Cryphonectria parasitica (strain ATCC 38755 / EP155) TaxID=660469 RepID=A0A9P4Y6J7_CRYP1|nr:uncharacterized protein M406DRAFT_321523 [Cryphonectria parasitica EP155]KAF3767292.1 hypothetical protein M406DRAFT_321523 [Cryphonectria parasitica EP155]
MSSALIYLKITLGLVAIASAIELAFISATVAYLVQISKQDLIATNTAGTSEPVNVPSLPANLSVNQGHTSNGAAGTGLIVIALAGSLALLLRSRPGYYASTPTGLFSRILYRLWLALNVPALLLTLGALAYVFAVTNAHAGQHIDASLLRGMSAGSKYPLLEWTPQGWFQALLELDLVPGDVNLGAIRSHLKIAKGWEYNLIPFFIVQLAETGCALWDARRRRREDAQYGPAVGEKGMSYGGGR